MNTNVRVKAVEPLSVKGKDPKAKDFAGTSLAKCTGTSLAFHRSAVGCFCEFLCSTVRKSFVSGQERSSHAGRSRGSVM